MRKRYALSALLVGAMLIAPTAASATQETPTPPGTCVPSDAIPAWTEVVPDIEHPAVYETVLDQPAVEGYSKWWTFEPNKHQGPLESAPTFPADPRGTWNGPKDNGGPGQDKTGVFSTSGGHGKASWFYRETVEDKEATYKEVIKTEAYTEVVPDIEHPEVPAITCTVTPVTPTVNDQCGIEDASDIVWPEAVNGSYKVGSITDLGNGTTRFRLVFTPNAGYTIPAGAYELVDGKAVWKIIVNNTVCPPQSAPTRPNVTINAQCQGDMNIDATFNEEPETPWSVTVVITPAGGSSYNIGLDDTDGDLSGFHPVIPASSLPTGDYTYTMHAFNGDAEFNDVVTGSVVCPKVNLPIPTYTDQCGVENDTNPTLGDVPKGAEFSWVDTESENDWSIRAAILPGFAPGVTEGWELQEDGTYIYPLVIEWNDEACPVVTPDAEPMPESLTVSPASTTKVLAATGVDADDIPVVALIGGLTVLLGACLAAMAGLRRKSKA